MKLRNLLFILGVSAFANTLMIANVIAQEGATVSVLETAIQAPAPPQIAAPAAQRPESVIQRTTPPDVNNGKVANTDQQGLAIGGPSGVNVGGGQGLRIGHPNGGLQYGGGQILRYGTQNAGVRIGGGEGFRMGTPNIGVQYGGGQILRWGTPNAGVRVGGGEGFRIGTSNAGIKIGPGGFQIGRFRN